MANSQPHLAKAESDAFGVLITVLCTGSMSAQKLTVSNNIAVVLGAAIKRARDNGDERFLTDLYRRLFIEDVEGEADYADWLLGKHH